MKEFRIFYGVFALAAAVMCVSYSSRLMPIILTVMVIVFFASFFLTLISSFLLKVSITPLPDSVFRKDEAVFGVSVQNRFFLPLMPLRVYVRVCAENKYAPENRVIIASVKPFSAATFKIGNIMSYRGRFEVGLDGVEFFDVLKICRFKKRYKNNNSPVSSPRVVTLKNLNSYNEDENENLSPKHNGFNKNVFSHLREYREGDTLRHIHWKLSARLDDLIVKQMEQNYNNAALIFCDFTGTYASEEAALVDSDPCIEAALALVRRILSNSNEAHLLYQDVRSGKSELRVINDEETLGEIENSLTMLPADAFSGNFTELLTEYENDIWVDRAIYIITPNLTYEFIEKIRSLGLTLRRNATVIIVNPKDRALMEYLESETKIGVFRIENDDISVLGERI